MARDTVILERRYVPKGTLVLKEGEDGNCAYLVQSGSVTVLPIMMETVSILPSSMSDRSLANWLSYLMSRVVHLLLRMKIVILL